MLPHEEIIPSHVDKIAAEIKKEGIQRDPMIIDAETGVVLDGMHRLAAFMKLGLDNAVCCPVDYASKTVSLHRWARVYTQGTSGSISQAVQDAGILRRATLSEAFAGLEGRRFGLAAFSSQGVFVPGIPLDLRGAFAVIGGLDAIARETRLKVEFVPEDEVDSALQDDGKVVLLIEKLMKDDVISAARSGKLFPCKTSMHAIDPRPVGANTPIEDLASITGPQLRKRLQESGGKLLPRDSYYQGRRYKERLLLLSPD